MIGVTKAVSTQAPMEINAMISPALTDGLES